MYQLTENNEKVIIVTLIKVNLFPRNLEVNAFVSRVWSSMTALVQAKSESVHPLGLTDSED